MTVTVLGATGKTGGTVAARLLAAGVKVKAVGRSADKLAALQKRGAQAIARRRRRRGGADRGLARQRRGLPDDSGRLHEARSARDSTRRAAEAIDRAVRDRGRAAGRVPEQPRRRDGRAGRGRSSDCTAPRSGSRAIGGLALLILRAGYFYENSYGTLGLIKHQGINGSAIEPGVAMPTIAAADIGNVAAEALLKSDFSGVVVRELTGPRDLTMAEVTGLLGKAIGKPDLSYVRFPDEGYVAGLEGAGFAPDAARLFLEMATAFNKGLVAAAAGDREGQDRDVVRGVRRRVRSGVPRGTVTGDIRGRRRAPDRRRSRRRR